MDYNHDVVSDLIQGSVARILAGLPQGVELVAAAKGRTPEEVLQAVQAGVKIIGENYVKEAKEAYQLVGRKAEWHFIGTFQKHNVRRNVLDIFDMVESVGSLEVAREIDRKCALMDKTMPVLIEVNSAGEPRKSGVLPKDLEQMVTEVSRLQNIKVMGLMTMGPVLATAEEYRPYFRETRTLFERIRRLELTNVEMRYLSMGMTDSYRVAIEEGANMIRIGAGIFGSPCQV
ncbi:MAG: YggS family pyridoxal phosphate-dependent enzyme [Dehalococcoidia bacterium]|nr:YggS family pyridoxal phosphate-dependent enzyme [Dehalococcoidia bacterium]